MSEAFPTLEEYNALLHERSGLNTLIAERAPKGSVIAEVNAESPRVFPERIQKERRLTTCAIGGVSEGYDQAIPLPNIAGLKEGFESSDLKPLLHDAKFGAVILSHQSEHIAGADLKEWILSAEVMLKEGGKIFVIDERGWNNRSQGVREAMIDIRRVLNNTIEITRYLVAPLLSKSFAFETQGDSGSFLLSKIMDELRQKTDKVKAEMHPIDRPLERELKLSNVEFLKGRFMIRSMVDELFIVSKLTEEQQKKRKEKRRKERKK